MKLNPLTLKFSGESSKLEAPFLSYYYRMSLPQLRIFLILGALLYASFGILDALLMPEQKYTIWFIRFVIVCPVLLGTLLASFSKSFERYMQPLLAVVLILAGGGIILHDCYCPDTDQLLLLCRPDACFHVGLHLHPRSVPLGFISRMGAGVVVRNRGHLDQSDALYRSASTTTFFSSAQTSLECWPVIPSNSMPGVIFS